MATTVVKTIGTGGDYSTLQAWEDACPANLVTSDQIWRGEVKNQEFTGTSTLLTIGGITVDSTRYVELTTQAGASFRDNANAATNALRYNASNGAAIKATGNYAKTIKIDVSYTRLSKLQIYNETSNNSYRALEMTGQFIDVDGCIIVGKALPVLSTNENNQFRNSLVIKTQTTGPIATFQTSSKVVNNTFVCPTDVGTCATGVNYQYATVTRIFRNNAIFGATTAFSGTPTTSETNYTDQASPPSGFTQATYADQFENTTNASGDFRLKSGSSLINAGTTDSTYGANSIIGTARPSGASYDVGAWEYVAAGGSTHNVTIANSQQSNVGTAGGVSQASTTFVAGSNSTQVNTASAGAVTQPAGGTITLPPLAEWETDTLLPSQSGITVWINHEETGALVLKLTGVTTAAVTAAFAPISHASIVAGTAYSVRTRLASGAQFTWTYTAS